VEQAQCLDGSAAKIDVVSESVPVPQTPALAPFLHEDACRREPNAECTQLAKELKELAKGIETLAATSASSSRKKQNEQFKLKNDTNCPICFTYHRCNGYGCWDEVVRASGKSTLFAGVSERAPEIKNPQFCASGGLLADWRPPLPPMKPALPPPLPPRKPGLTLAVADSGAYAAASEAIFLAAKEKATREGVWTLTEEDIRGLSLRQISELRGY
jgi:hypothetical protein